MPRGTEPITMISASTPVGDCEVSPPARTMLECFASLSRPLRKPSIHFCGRFCGTAKDKKAAIGTPPIAAMSLSPRVRQRCPTDSGGCHSRRKCTPSRLKSVVTNVSYSGGMRSTAESSPIPATTRELCRFNSPVCWRMREISCLSGKGKARK